MKKLTEKYIFECKLKGTPVVVNANSWINIYRRLDDIAMLVETGVFVSDLGTEAYDESHGECCTATVDIMFRANGLKGTHLKWVFPKGEVVISKSLTLNLIRGFAQVVDF